MNSVSSSYKAMSSKFVSGSLSSKKHGLGFNRCQYRLQVKPRGERMINYRRVVTGGQVDTKTQLITWQKMEKEAGKRQRKKFQGTIPWKTVPGCGLKVWAKIFNSCSVVLVYTCEHQLHICSQKRALIWTWDGGWRVSIPCHHFIMFHSMGHYFRG